MVAVKTSTEGWDKMKSGLGNLIGSGVWGKGVIDDLKEINKHMENAEEKIQEKDTDGVISFSHTSKKSKYTDLFEKLEVLHSYSGKAHGLVEEHIDDPFYKAIDGYVEAMEQLSINDYSTDNTIGTTEVVMTSIDGYTFDTQTKKKDKITADDLFADDTILGKQMKKDFNEFKTKYQGDKDEMPDYKDYKAGMLNTGAFEYKSIKDSQMEKEMWVNIGLGITALVVGIVCPPAGAALGLALAAGELTSAATGKDWISGRELDTGERWTRGALAAVSIVFDVSTLKSFSQATRQANAVKYAATGGASKLNHLSDMVVGAKDLAKTRIASFGNSLKSLPTKLKNGYNSVKTQVGKVKNVVVNKASESFGKLQDAWEQGRTTFEQARKNFQNGLNNLFPQQSFVTPEGVRISMSQADDLVDDAARMVSSSTGSKAIPKTPPKNYRIPEQAQKILDDHKLTIEDFNRINANPNKTQKEIALLKEIREKIPTPTSTTDMRKVIPVEFVDGTITNPDYANVGGFITEQKYVDDIVEMGDVFDSSRLDYEGTLFNRNGDHAYIDFTSNDIDNIKTPYGPDFGGTENSKWPFTGSGFTAGENGTIIPEWKTLDGGLKPNIGSTIHEVIDGNDTIVAIYDFDPISKMTGWMDLR